ncbi:hypothetical protein V6N13_011143 [Hibiscus sabdariffa]
MEGGDILKASNSLRAGSLRAGSSSIWRNSAVDVFSRSSRDEDDEEALKWAALEKLPTVARLRKGILTGSQGGANEIDVSNLGWQERRTILERLVRVAEEDNEQFLLKLKNRINRVGIDLPTIEVRYENLNIEAEAFVGTNALPSVLNFITGIFENFLIDMGILSSRKKKLTILKDVSGIIKPSRMTLLLGPPSSGKTTLLLALAGKLDPALKFSGTVTYNGHGMNEFVPQRTAAYISQHDLHLGEMTVRETLAFSARCQGVGTRYDMLAELSRREKEANIKPDPDIDVFMKAAATEGQEANVITDYILKILGLDVCADTIVGNEMLRGISGGQRKRVTTGEMLVGPARALFMDEISTEVSIWVFLTYYVIGFDPNIERLFRQYLILVLINQMASGLFRSIAALGRNLIVANTFGSFALLVLFALGGFVLSREDIKGWWIWGYWISPMMYGQNALMANEFLGNQWRRVLPGSNESLGIEVLKSRSFFTEAYWYWIGVGGLVGFVLLFNFGYTLALTFLNPLEKNQAVIADESESNDQANGVGGSIQLTSQENSSSHVNRSEIQDDIQKSTSSKSFSMSDATVGAIGKRKKGMVLPFEPHSITFDDIVYSVDMPQEMKEQGVNEDRLVLLKGVSGAFRPGVLTALMGVSGAGLDARAAAIVMRTVRNTVDTGRTVVCTIHQPSIDIFEAFDELFLMKRGGQEIYVGPLGHHSKHLIKYFEGIQGVSKIKDGYNPATWMLEVTTSAQELSLGVDFAEIYKNSDLFRRNKALIKDLSKPAPGAKELYFPTQYSQSFLTQLFWNLGSKTKKVQDLSNAMGSMYAAVLFLGIQNSASVQPVVAVERTVFYRERAAGMYSAMPYAIAQVLIEIPYIFVQAFVYGIIVYAMIGFEWTVAKFFWYLFFMFFTLLYFTFYGFIIPRPVTATSTRVCQYGGDGTPGFVRCLGPCTDWWFHNLVI